MKGKQAKQKRRIKMKHRKKRLSQKGENKRLMLQAKRDRLTGLDVHAFPLERGKIDGIFDVFNFLSIQLHFLTY